MTGNSWTWMETPPASASFNMAMDEALLLGAFAEGMPILRFYSWSEPAATFGYFQKYDSVAQMTALRPLIRRCTGGGLVSHDADWTYSLVFPTPHAWRALRAEASYLRLHEWIRSSLRKLGMDAVLAPCCAKEQEGACFAGPEKFDLTWNNTKIAGAAQRRTREGLLIQGSLQRLPDMAGRDRWQESLRETAAESWGVHWKPPARLDRIRQTAEELDRTKYSQGWYNRGER